MTSEVPLTSYGPGVFSDEEFEKASQEVVNPDLSGFEFFVESHGTKIYRNYKEVREVLGGQGRGGEGGCIAAIVIPISCAHVVYSLIPFHCLINNSLIIGGRGLVK